MYLEKPNDKQWVIDIETDSLNPTVIWVLCAKNVGTGLEKTLTNINEIREFINGEIERGCVFIGHNIIKFDGPVLNRLAGTRLTIDRLVDTFVLSMVYSPSLMGGHSLDAWGKRLKLLKGEFDALDFAGGLTDKMVEYCVQDVLVTYTCFIRLTERMRQVGFTDKGLWIEHHAWEVIRKQQNNGFAFNKDEAERLYQLLSAKLVDLRKEIYHHWPPELLPIKTYKSAYKKDGSRSKNFETHIQKFPKVEIHADGSYTAYDTIEFDLASPNQRLDKLMSTGWKPRERTKSGKSWKVTEKGELVPSLVEWIDNNKEDPKAKGAVLLADWITLNGRATMINTWLEAYNERTGCIHGSLWMANTLRYRHSNPNTANIPAVAFDNAGKPALGDEGGFTYESRDLWTVRDRSNRKLVGVDAKGIQLRVLAHYLNNPEFTKQLLEGDPHEYNRKLAGIGTRAKAKTFIYAFLLGAGDAKVGTIIEGTQRDGKEVKHRFINNFPGLSELLDRLAAERARTGRIILADGIPLLVSQDHIRLGYLLQGDESRIMKLASIFVDRQVTKENLDVLKVGDIHDEWQSDVLDDHVERYIEICEWAFKKAGEHFNYNIPIECDAKVGMTWAETH